MTRYVVWGEAKILFCDGFDLLSFAKVMKPGHGTVAMGRGGFSLPNQGD